jgi:hypothetical protein
MLVTSLRSVIMEKLRGLKVLPRWQGVAVILQGASRCPKRLDQPEAVRNALRAAPAGA